MNETTLTQLKITVERAVRPVRACVGRKVKMRKELLAHVIDAYEEEARTGNEQAAVERVQARFGQPVEVTSQLQATVPRSDWYDRVVEDWLFGPDETILRRAAVLGAGMSLILGVLFLFMFLVIQPLRGPLALRGNNGPEHIWPIVPAAAIGVFSFLFLSLWMRRALFGAGGRSWPRTVLIGVMSSLLVPAVTFGVCLAATGDLWSSLSDLVRPDELGIPLMGWAMLLTWIPVASFAYATEMHQRYQREWANLPIEA